MQQWAFFDLMATDVVVSMQTGTQTHRHTDTQAHRHTDTQAHRHTDTHAHRHTCKLYTESNDKANDHSFNRNK